MFTHQLIEPGDIDKALRWRPGTARRLAIRRKLPHIVLPNNEIRFRWSEIESLIREMPAHERAAQEVGV